MFDYYVGVCLVMFDFCVGGVLCVVFGFVVVFVDFIGIG